jgi:prepilin-type N-terminal cleavage/methylation domain-containing protein
MFTPIQFIQKSIKIPLNKIPLKRGFTLTELMVAAFLTLLVASFGGWSVATIISFSKTNESENERRGELNRALDFISTEIRQSTKIHLANINPIAFNPSATDVDVVLRIKIQELPENVIYYIATPDNPIWRGPKVIYRWGPDFNEEGVYSSDLADPTTWKHKPLIDAIDNTDSTIPCPTERTSPSHPTGFYACIKDEKIAQLYIKGQINKVLGVKVPYLATSQVFARTTLNAIAALPPGIGGGAISLPGPSTTQMKILGSAIQCGEGAPPINTQLVINTVRDGQTVASRTIPINPASLPTIPPFEQEPAGTTFSFTGSIPPQAQNPNNTCRAESITGPISSTDNSIQVKIFRNGDAVPDVEGFAGSLSAKAYINDYLDASKTSIKLNDNQYIILFELGETNPNERAFDLQDLVVLATVNPA